jgi:hypothetical protein
MRGRKWTPEDLQKTGGIRKYGERIFYATQRSAFVSILNLASKNSDLIKTGPVKRTSRGFFSGDIDLTSINYCGRYDHELGTCTQRDDEKQHDCIANNYYCNRFLFADYIFIRAPKNRQ